MLATLALAALPAALPQADPLAAAVQHAFEFSAARLDAATRGFPSERYPSSTTSSGAGSGPRRGVRGR